MRNIILFIRHRYHPLFHLRRFYLFKLLTRLLDVPVAIRFPSIAHPIYVSLTKNLAFVLSAGEAGENLERGNFTRLCMLGQFTRFADVGANIGLYGFLFRAHVSAGVVTMFEPDPRNAALIIRTLTKNGISNIQLLQAAASDVSGTVTFLVDDLSGATGAIDRGAAGTPFVSLHHNTTPRSISIKSVLLDDIYSGADDPELIKIDVEGAELKVLHGAKNLLARSQPAIIFECDYNQEQMLEFLTARGYIFFDLTTLQRIYKLAHNSLAMHSIKHATLISRASCG
jgi:FkbM family methyltransferase